MATPTVITGPSVTVTPPKLVLDITSDQLITDSTWDVITLASVSALSSGTVGTVASGVLTFTNPGQYSIGCTLRMSGLTDGKVCYVRANINNGAYLFEGFPIYGSGGGQGPGSAVHFVHDFAANDTLRFQAFHNVGTDQNAKATSGAQHKTWAYVRLNR